MTESFDRRQYRFTVSRYFEDLVVGERFYIPSRSDAAQPQGGDRTGETRDGRGSD